MDPRGRRARDRGDGEDVKRPVRPIEGEREDQFRGRALEEAGKERVDRPLAPEKGRHARGDHLGEQGGAGLSDDERGEDGRHKPHAVDRSRSGGGREHGPAAGTLFQAQNTTPNTTPITAATTMSRVRQRLPEGRRRCADVASCRSEPPVERTPSPGGDGVNESTGLLPSPVRAGSGSAGLWRWPHSQRTMRSPEAVFGCGRWYTVRPALTFGTSWPMTRDARAAAF